MSGCSMQKCMNFSPLTHIESGYAQYKAHLQLAFIPSSSSSSSHLDLTAFFSFMKRRWRRWDWPWSRFRGDLWRWQRREYHNGTRGTWAPACFCPSPRRQNPCDTETSQVWACELGTKVRSEHRVSLKVTKQASQMCIANTAGINLVRLICSNSQVSLDCLSLFPSAATVLFDVHATTWTVDRLLHAFLHGTSALPWEGDYFPCSCGRCVQNCEVMHIFDKLLPYSLSYKLKRSKEREKNSTFLHFTSHCGPVYLFF